MLKNKSVFVLVDGNSLLHRAFHALPSLKIPSGQETGAVYGFSSMFLTAWSRFRPDFVAFAFDTKGPTFRHKLFNDYKAHRPPMDEALLSQIPLVKEVVNSLGVPRFEVQGFEGDDILGTLIKEVKSIFSDEEIEVIILTGDLDMLQLIDSQVRVCTSRRGVSDIVTYGENEVFERFGIDVPQFLDYKALVGDSSDNIPGVKGIGPKRAKDLLREFKDLEGVYANLEKVKDSLSKKLSASREEAFLSRKLVEIFRDVPIHFDIEKCVIKESSFDQTRQLFQKFHFHSLIKRLPHEEDKESQGKLFLV